jgi:hypothetical protein
MYVNYAWISLASIFKRVMLNKYIFYKTQLYRSNVSNLGENKTRIQVNKLCVLIIHINYCIVFCYSKVNDNSYVRFLCILCQTLQEKGSLSSEWKQTKGRYCFWILSKLIRKSINHIDVLKETIEYDFYFKGYFQSFTLDECKS